MSLLETLIGEFREKKYPETLVERNVSTKDLTGKVRVVLGIRRSGKTFFLYQLIRQLQKQGEALSQILYLNFEDERLLPLDAKGLGALVDEFYRLFPENHDKVCRFFFDEIQNVENWPLVIRRLLDTGKIRLTLTGSSSKMLSKEIASSLRGRAYPIEIWPFSFEEYLELLHQEKPARLMGPAAQHRLLKQLKTYLITGGFAEVARLEAPERNIVLQEYTNTLLFRDIVERHNLTHLSLVRKLIKTIVMQCSSKVAINKIFKDFKSQGLSVSKNTLHDYLSYIEDAYFAFTVPLYTSSFRKQNVHPRKVYLADTGLFTAHATVAESWGLLFENLVYIDLRRRHDEIWYYVTESGYEVDFVVKTPTGSRQIIQVSWDISNKETLARESRALEEAKKELKIRDAFLLTPDTYFKWLCSFQSRS